MDTRLCQLCILLHFDCFRGQARAEHEPLFSHRPSHLSVKQHNMTHAFANGHLLGPNYFLQPCFPATLQVDVSSVLGSFSPGSAKTKWHTTKCFKHSSLTCLLPCIVDSRWISILFKNPVWQLGLWGMLSLSQRSMCTFHNICLTSLLYFNIWQTALSY